MSCPHSEGTYAGSTESVTQTVTKDGKQCTQYGLVHIDLCCMCDKEMARRTSWGQVDCS